MHRSCHAPMSSAVQNTLLLIVMFSSYILSTLHPHIYFCGNQNLYLRYDYLNYITFCACVLHCISTSNKKLKRDSTNKYWGEICCKKFTLFYFNFRNIKFKIFRKWHERHLVAYDLKAWWGNPIYIDLEIKSCSKEVIAVTSLLTLHTTHTTTKEFHWYTRRHSNYVSKSAAKWTVILECVWESIYRKAFTQF